MKLTLSTVARMIDLSAVRTDVDADEIRALCVTAMKYHCAAVSILPCYTGEARELLRDAPEVYLDGNVGFPSGAELTAIKAAQARELIELGCDELDMVMNVGWLKSGRDVAVEQDVRVVVDAADGRPVKVIIEVACLTDDEVRRACEICEAAGAAFIKTGTGWLGKPTTVEHIRLIRSIVGNSIPIKAAGGIRDIATIGEMYRLGVARFGLGFQSGTRILEEWAALPGQALEIPM